MKRKIVGKWQKIPGEHPQSEDERKTITIPEQFEKWVSLWNSETQEWWVLDTLTVCIKAVTESYLQDGKQLNN